MKVRGRLLVVSLMVAAVVSVVAGWAIARSRDDAADGDSVEIDSQATFDVPSIETNSVVDGAPFPDVSVQTVDGNELPTGDLVGQPMVVNIWGSTCTPCKKELPDFAEAHAEYGDEVRFVGISYLPASDREEAFARDRGIDYELLYDANGEFITAAGLAVFPVTLFVAPDGTIIEQTGQLDLERLRTLIEEDLL
ncbi:MAG TPA: TlpA disulfide reductase family protein [Ilumatobacteraceae bacterium]|nr:TlpA disulfide reductase family protein [Ilumatobacteraceae bacterium]